MIMSESIVDLSIALAKFQGEVKQPVKDGTNPHFRSQFVTLDGVVAAITETASKYGLSFLQFPLNEDNKIGVKTLLLHTSGQFIEGEAIYATPTKNDPQGVGATLTYLRRYSLSAIFGITSETDDDANSASSLPNAQNNNRQQNQSNNLTQQFQQRNSVIFNTLQEAESFQLPFTKYKGTTLKELVMTNEGMTKWLLDQPSVDEGIKNGLRMIINSLGGN